MDSSSQDKNLPATGRKLDKAREDGQVARSKDLSNLAVLGVGGGALVVLAPILFEQLRHALALHLAFDARTVQQPAAMLQRLGDFMLLGIGASAAFASLIAVAALASSVGGGGWTLSAKPLMPDFGRLNPIKGIQNLFSKQQLANVAKLALLAAILGVVAWVYLKGSMHSISSLVLQPAPTSITVLCKWLVQGLVLMLLVLVAAAVIDVPLQAFFFKNRLKMSHEEVKQEHKESEGSPEMKGHRRQRQREMAMKASITKVPKADFVVMNPTHFAVALAYDDTTMGAPRVVAKGADLLAMRIRDVARDHQVPVLQAPLLARALYANAELDQPIPAALYTAVAQVLAYVYRLKAALRGEGAMPQTQPDPFVAPELDPHDPRFDRHAAARAAATGN